MFLFLSPVLAQVETTLRAVPPAPASAPMACEGPVGPWRDTSGMFARVTTRPEPASAAVSRSATQQIWRAADGLFYIDGRINGQSVRFIVDTGASMTVLTLADARSAGIDPDHQATPLVADTARGKSTMAGVVIQSFEVAGQGSSHVKAAVAREGLQVSLLGQDFLSHVASVTIEGDRMLLR